VRDCQSRACWDKWKVKLKHEYVIDSWALSVLPEVREDVNKRFTKEHRDIIEALIVHLHVSPCPNPSPGFTKMMKGELISTDGTVLMFVLGGHTPVTRNTHAAHTQLLGFITCWVTSNQLGIGTIEQRWGNVKHTIKTGKGTTLEGSQLNNGLFFTRRRGQTKQGLGREPWRNLMLKDQVPCLVMIT